MELGLGLSDAAGLQLGRGRVGARLHTVLGSELRPSSSVVSFGSPPSLEITSRSEVAPSIRHSRSMASALVLSSMACAISSRRSCSTCAVSLACARLGVGVRAEGRVGVRLRVGVGVGVRVAAPGVSAPGVRVVARGWPD